MLSARRFRYEFTPMFVTATRYSPGAGVDESGAAVKYVVAEHPWLEDGDLRWASGEYLNFCHYFTSGEALLGAARVMHQTCQ